MRNAETNRRLSVGVVSLTGLAAGVACYLVAEALTPQQPETAGDHDLALAVRLGFIYTPVVGMWLGWAQRSRTRALVGAVVGVLVGFAYMRLCQSRDFFAIMVTYPLLLGGVLAAMVSSSRSAAVAGLPGRFGKGMLAGGVLGFVYMFLLNAAAALAVHHEEDYTRFHVRMMWVAGPFALGLASSLFFVVIRWAVGLARVRLLVFEDVEEQRPEDVTTAE